MSLDAAILHLRRLPEHRFLVEESYLGEDVFESAGRFFKTGEFSEVQRLLARRGGIAGKRVLDLGAGRGISSWAFCQAGAAQVLAIEPDPSELVGRGSLVQLMQGQPYELIDAFGESVPVPDASVDIAYCRQVLHHTSDLPKVMRELYRVLKPGGQLLCCREHVANNAVELAAFLRSHIVHNLAGGEHAYSERAYRDAISRAGFRRLKANSELSSVISAFPQRRTRQEVDAFFEELMVERFGKLWSVASLVPGARALMLNRSNRHLPPGRMYTFYAVKP